MRNFYYSITTKKHRHSRPFSAGLNISLKSAKVGQLIQLQSINNSFFSGNQSTRHITIQGDVRLEKEEAERSKEDTTSSTHHLPHISRPPAWTRKPNTHTHTHITLSVEQTLVDASKLPSLPQRKKGAGLFLQKTRSGCVRLDKRCDISWKNTFHTELR